MFRGVCVPQISRPIVWSWLKKPRGPLFRITPPAGKWESWRLPGLQRAIKAGSLGSFKDLLAMDANAFYGDTRGVNYAQARYLCYYLQQKGLLFPFYKQFHANQKTDPTGYETLKSVLKETDMHQFQRKWQKFVLDLNQEFSLTLEN